MRYRPRWSLLSLGALIVILLFTFPTWRKVFLGRSSGGRFPAASDAQVAVFAQWGKEANNGKVDPVSAATAYVSMLTVVPAPTTEQPTPVLPDAQPIGVGKFADIDAVRTASGTMTLYRSTDGSVLLRFDTFSVTNAPQLIVYLTGNSAPQTPADLDSNGVSRFPVGALKGTKGNQQYPIPREMNLSKYHSVVIYSDTLHLIYAFAVFQ